MHRFRPAFLSQYFVGQMVFSNSAWRWWLFDKSAYEPAEMMDRFLGAGHSAGITPLGGKANQSRLYYRLDAAQQPGTPRYFAKLMKQRPRARLGALLGSHSPVIGCSHGTAELAHSLALHERTSHGVRTFAFGECFRAGLPERQVLLQEYLDGWQPFDAVWRQSGNRPGRRRELLRKFATLLAALRDAGIGHLDLHPGNVMVSPDPQAPLRAIDCGKMDMTADPALAAALHLGVFLFSLNGGHRPASPRLENGARQLLARLVGERESHACAAGLLPLLLRYSTRKPFSRRLLLWPQRTQLDLEALEVRLQRIARHGRSASAIDSLPEQWLVESLDALLHPPARRAVLCENG